MDHSVLHLRVHGRLQHSLGWRDSFRQAFYGGMHVHWKSKYVDYANTGQSELRVFIC